MSGLHQPHIGRLAIKFLDGVNNTSNRQRSNQPTMNTYQRQLLDKLITELTDNASPNLHAAQMLAAELKGAMQAQDAPQKPTPDADGWVKNSGVYPRIGVAKVKFRHGGIYQDNPAYRWAIIGDKTDITHYLPA